MIDTSIQIWNKYKPLIEKLSCKWGIYTVLKETAATRGAKEALDLFFAEAKERGYQEVF